MKVCLVLIIMRTFASGISKWNVEINDSPVTTDVLYSVL